MGLYTWQKESIRIWYENQFQGIVNVVTGGGKTVMALYAARVLEKYLKSQSTDTCSSLRIKIVVPTFPLAAQWARAMEKYLPDCGSLQQKPGFYHSERKDNPQRKYMIYIINSARYSLARHIVEDIQNGFHIMLIADECHHYASPENQKIFDFLKTNVDAKKYYHSLGLSATPQVHNYHSVLVPALGKEIYQYGFSKAAKEKNVCNFSIYQIALSFTSKEGAEYGEISDKLSIIYQRLMKKYPYLRTLDRTRFFAAVSRIAEENEKDTSSLARVFLNLSYKRQELNHMASSRISCTVTLVDLLDSKERILIFGERIKQAEKVYKELSRRYPNQVGCYHSEMSPLARKNALARFHDGSSRILVSCRALDEGIDVPDATVGIVLSGASVNRQRIQRLGRILRRQKEKYFVCLYYLYIWESADDSAFLPDQEEKFTVCNLSYNSGENIFCHPSYENTAASLLKITEKNHVGKILLNEMRRCISVGLVRSDWLLPVDICSEQIKKAKNQREKNYWICMKQMAKLSGSLTAEGI